MRQKPKEPKAGSIIDTVRGHNIRIFYRMRFGREESYFKIDGFDQVFDMSTKAAFFANHQRKRSAND